MNSKLTFDDDSFSEFSNLAHRLTGISIKSERKNMLEGRLQRRLRDLAISSYDDYLVYIKCTPAEKEFFTNAVTTNETYFYRTPRIWDFISNTYLPQWLDHNTGRTLRVWSAASSTGEEGHTAGIVMQAFKDANKGFDYRILGTDIDTSVVATANHGVYKGRAVERFRRHDSELFSRYMIGNETDGFKVHADIKQKLDFQVFNLFDNADSLRYDLVLIRNVLIYFSREDQTRVMQQVLRKINEEGLVIIGESESLNSLSIDLDPLTPTIYRNVSKHSTRKAA